MASRTFPLVCVEPGANHDRELQRGNADRRMDQDVVIGLDFRDDGRPWTYDRQGRPLTWDQYVSLRYVNGTTKQNHDYIVVKCDQLADVVVSTVWLGLDHGFGGLRLDAVDAPPIIFETMTFSTTSEEWDAMLFARYSSEAAAVIGHMFACAFVMGGSKALAAGEP